MTQFTLYKSIDRLDGEESGFLVNEKTEEVAIFSWTGRGEQHARRYYNMFLYAPPAYIDRAVDKELVCRFDGEELDV